METIENTCGKRGEHCPSLLRKEEGAASGVGAPSFSPRDWLARWRDAGGAWANSTLLLPPQHRRSLQTMVDELAPDEIRAIAAHLGAKAAA